MKPAAKKLLISVAANLVSPVLGLTWAVFAASTWFAWVRTHSVVALLLFAVNTLFALLFIVRRRSLAVTENPRDWMITAATILLSFSLRVEPADNIAVRAVSQSLQGMGVVVILFSLVSLGRSFGLVPANRGIKTRSMYGLVRHPLYGGEILFYLGFLVGNPMIPNAIVFAAIVVGLNLRAAAEERFLGKDAGYESYLQRVRFRFIPRVY